MGGMSLWKPLVPLNFLVYARRIITSAFTIENCCIVVCVCRKLLNIWSGCTRSITNRDF